MLKAVLAVASFAAVARAQPQNTAFAVRPFIRFGNSEIRYFGQRVLAS